MSLDTFAVTIKRNFSHGWKFSWSLFYAQPPSWLTCLVFISLFFSLPFRDVWIFTDVRWQREKMKSVLRNDSSVFILRSHKTSLRRWINIYQWKIEFFIEKLGQRGIYEMFLNSGLFECGFSILTHSRVSSAAVLSDCVFNVVYGETNRQKCISSQFVSIFIKR